MHQLFSRPNSLLGLKEGVFFSSHKHVYLLIKNKIYKLMKKFQHIWERFSSDELQECTI